ncbi:MAG: hypothetical protein K2G88_05870, partial [Oscillospiraceae bacterium]|nr:hypothetical protein [Oscillospiraceae bacterium]
DKVIDHARELLKELESNKIIEKLPESEQQFSFAIAQESEVLKNLKRINIAELSDTECREFLEELCQMLT